MKPAYCINDQVENCQLCSYVNYGRDCQNNPITRDFTIKQITDCLKIGERATRKLLNDAGAKLDEMTINPDELVSRETVINLLAIRAGSREGRLLAGLLGKG